MKKLLAMLLCLTMVLGASLSFASCKKTQKEDNATYTYNRALTVFPTNWNPHRQQTLTDTTILDYTQPGFFSFDYNDKKDGYKLVPELATKEPEDVTSQYIGKYGLKDGDTARAYKITLRNDIKWQDGTAINANDFVTSAQLLLKPTAKNYRADSLYSGNMVIHNAQNYLYSGQQIWTANSEDGEALTTQLASMKKDADGVYTTDGTTKVYFGLKTAYQWMGGKALEDYKDKNIPAEVWNGLSAKADEEGYVPVTDEMLDLLFKFTGSGDWGNEKKDQLAYYMSYQKTYPKLEWNEVGMFAASDNELVIVMDKPLSGFYLLYSLTDSWLVNAQLYGKCETEKNGVYDNTYGTSLDTTMSYGPYKLTEFQSDKIIKLEKNNYFYGYNDKANKDLYQTTSIQIDYVPEASTRLGMFLNGKLDTYQLSADDMEAYSKSDYTYYTTGESTFFIALNPNLDALKTAQTSAGSNTNKTILTVPEFRQALSYGLDRAAFCLATSPTNNAAFGVFSNLIISDPDNGIAYRTTEQAKQVIANFWGLSNDIGSGKPYKTLDDAINSLTGYNLAKAQELFNAAYDKAVSEGLLKDTDKIEIKVGTPNATSNFYNKGYEFLVNNYTQAVKGTKLEGKLTFTLDNTLGNGFSNALKNNQVDLLFGVGWNGSALDPYSLMEAYTGDQYQYDPSWDTKSAKIDVTIKNKAYTATVWDWTTCIMGEEITAKAADGTTLTISAGSDNKDAETRLDILAALENAVLETYDMIPIMDDSTADLKGMQIKYYTEDYIYGVARGGVKYMTYSYSDAKWNEYVSAQGGELNYK